MKLFIAEKPSLGKAIADNLPGPHSRGDGFISCGEGNVVTWCFGHLLEQAPPPAYGQQYEQWSFASLPIVPEKWVLLEKADAKKQIGVIKGLLAKADEVVNAGDPDREGQMLVDELLDHLKNKRPVSRIWLSALDTTSVKRALGSLKSNLEYQNLYHSAIARSRADWLVGMNLSRAYTLAARAATGFGPTLSIGRVQTPTLKLVVDRDREIANFVPKDFFIPVATVQTAKGNFQAKWMIPEGVPVDSAGRIVNREVADKVKARVEASPAGQITLKESKEKKQAAPMPFSLSTLQIYASKRWGYGAQEVLDACQALYETHELTSYPRTDCAYLPESQLPDAPKILSNISGVFPAAQGANASLKSRAWNDKEVTAHHAIVPTLKNPGTLGSLKHIERDLYEAICLRYIAQFYPEYRYSSTEIEATFGQDVFRATGSIPLHPGWKVVYGMTGEDDDAGKDDENQNLPDVKAGDPAKAAEVTIKQKTTTPPERFTEGKLIEAMTNVHQFVENQEIKKRLKEVAGIGTEATRANIIVTLLRRGFLEKQGKGKSEKLVSTEAGRALIDALPTGVKDPGMTALWEGALESIAQGKADMEAFVRNQTNYVLKLVEEARALKLSIPDIGRPAGGKSGSGKSYGGAGKSGGRSGSSSGKSSGAGAPRKPAEDAGMACEKCGAPMLKRTSKNGGKPFLGCSAFPKCSHTVWPK